MKPGDKVFWNGRRATFLEDQKLEVVGTVTEVALIELDDAIPCPCGEPHLTKVVTKRSALRALREYN